ncbi:sigma-70 family RNA polymerase sigma factor [Paractinoplanes hotanensis]|uniref:RNA polymerase sigma factor n=1 Tax=Paractinoplanes hotanensis TaxID=2906497 RepID=A0ABT0XS86_9ACTN|nr:sigma-70 family RNA polymerase sigma factor [Actinoplanes hotanensis]MCM4076628.1 sigma-70 family RNA polymerase sigma factor [Actinoplanes hotanensis]
MAVPRPVRDDEVVLAARAGDREALNELSRRHLPLVYNLVRRVLHDDAQVDDVVQDVMVRALRQLGDLRSPGSFRSWLTAIAVHQVGTHVARENAVAGRAAPLEAADDREDAAAEVEGPAVLRAALSGQRRQVRLATAWLGAEERTVFSLWWLELAGELTRAEVADALDVSVAHAGVRIQRMREQLGTSRGIVAALEAVPGCEVLGAAVAGWDGTASPYWRKRLGRHVRSCPVCARATGELVPDDRLLLTLALLPVPIALTGAALVNAAAYGEAATAALAKTLTAASWAGRAAHAAAAHPLVAVVGAGVLAVGVTVPATGWATGTQPPPGAAVGSPQPRTSAGPLAPGSVSLESAAAPGRFVAVSGDEGVLEKVGPADAPADRQRATLQVVPGLADPLCVSLRSSGGRYLRHQNFRLRLSGDDGTVLFRRDATFCSQAGYVPGGISLESYNFRGFFVRRVGGQLGIDQFDGSAEFRADSSLFVRPGLI